MNTIWLSIGVALVLLVLGAVFFGAPYVPTRKRDVEEALKLISKGDVLVDLGSGDGRLVKAAAEQGIRAQGIELSPILALIGWVRTRHVRRHARICIGNYWRMRIPDDTTVVFVFLADAYMRKLRDYLEAEAARLGRTLTLISYGFELPGYVPVRTKGALLVYAIKP